MGDPSDGIEDNAAVVIVLPVLVEMAAGETKGAALAKFFRALISPHHVLGFLALKHRSPHSRVAFVGAVFAFEGFRSGQVAEDGGDALHVFAEAHVVIPLVADLELADAAADRVLGGLERGVPMRIDGPIGFKVAADEVEEGVSRVTLGDFHAVVDATDACAGIGDLAELGEVLHRRVTAAAVGVEDDSVSPIKHGFILRPTVGDHHGFHGQAAFFEVIGQQHGSRAVLVLAGGMARAASNEDDLFLGGRGRGGFAGALIPGGNGGDACASEREQQGAGEFGHGNVTLRSKTAFQGIKPAEGKDGVLPIFVGWCRAFQRAVLVAGLAVSPGARRADHPDRATSQRGLENGCRVHATAGRIGLKERGRLAHMQMKRENAVA